VAALATIACRGLRPVDDHAARAPRRRARTHPEQADAPQDAQWPTSPTCTRPGHLLAAGPLLDRTSPFRGLSILSAGGEEGRALKERDPAVQANKYRIIALPWMVPAGATFSANTFPRSTSEAAGT
jgi:uncharacterized protein